MRIDATGHLGPERDAFVALLDSLSDREWGLATECPAWTVKGVALHVLGDDLSLLARQRDAATPGVMQFAEGRSGVDFVQLLDGFNEQWVHHHQIRRSEEGWSLLEGPATAPRAALSIADDEVPNLLTRGPNTASTTTTIDGDADLAIAVGIGLTR